MSSNIRITADFTIVVHDDVRPYHIKVHVDTDGSVIAIDHSDCKGAGKISLTGKEMRVVNHISDVLNSLRHMTDNSRRSSPLGIFGDDDD